MYLLWSHITYEGQVLTGIVIVNKSFRVMNVCMYIQVHVLSATLHESHALRKLLVPCTFICRALEDVVPYLEI